MELFECMKARKSVRRYRTAAVEEDKIRAMIEAGLEAPCAGNVREVFFVVVTDSTVRHELGVSRGGRRGFDDVPVVIAVCANLDEISQRYGSKGRDLYAIQDAAAATENLVLAATALGLGTCWVGAFDEDAARDALGLSPYVRVTTLITAGYPDENPKKPARPAYGDVVSYL